VFFFFFANSISTFMIFNRVFMFNLDQEYKRKEKFN
jgi:hypothetical protein